MGILSKRYRDFSDISVVYMTMDDRESSEWRLLMLSDFKCIGITPTRFDGILGNLGLARYNMLKTISTEFVYMVDPDDRVDPRTFIRQLEEMRNRKYLAMCGCREGTISTSGEILSISHGRPFDINRFKLSPLELHNGTIMRTEVMKEVIDDIHKMNFYNFDWALRYAIAKKGEVERIQQTGYYFRRKPDSHHMAKNVPADMIPPILTTDVVDIILSQ